MLRMAKQHSHIDKHSHHQVKSNYMKNIACKVAENVAFQLGVLEMKRFFNNMPQVALDKKSNFDFMEREIGLGKFLPSTIINRFLYSHVFVHRARFLLPAEYWEVHI